MDKHMLIDMGPLEVASDLKHALDASLHGDIMIRKGFFPSTGGFSFIARRIDCDMDTIFSTFRNGYAQQWIQGSEMDVAMVAYALTAKIWIDLGPLAGLGLEINQNMVDRLGATSENLRPDLCAWMDGALLFKGEMKRSDSDFEIAKAELTSKMNGWSTMSLSGLPFLPSFAVGGRWIQFFAVCPPPRSDAAPTISAVSSKWDMRNSTDRLSIMRVSCNMLRVFSSLRKRMPNTVPRLYARIDRTGGHIEIMDSFVYKVCIPAPDIVYNALHGVPCVVRVVSRTALSDGLFKLRIEPLCAEVLPVDVIELKSCIRNLLSALSQLHLVEIIHRDIRWPNVLRAPDSSWLLADFELANTESVPFPPKSINSKYLPPEVISGSGYSARGDVYRVGMLIKEWEKAGGVKIPDDVRAWSDRLTAVDPSARPTAANLLLETGSWLQV